MVRGNKKKIMLYVLVVVVILVVIIGGYLLFGRKRTVRWTPFNEKYPIGVILHNEKNVTVLSMDAYELQNVVFFCVKYRCKSYELDDLVEWEMAYRCIGGLDVYVNLNWSDEDKEMMKDVFEEFELAKKNGIHKSYTQEEIKLLVDGFSEDPADGYLE